MHDADHAAVPFADVATGLLAAPPALSPLAALLLNLHDWSTGTENLDQCCNLLRDGLDLPWAAFIRLDPGDSRILAWSGDEEQRRGSTAVTLAALRRTMLATASSTGQLSGIACRSSEQHGNLAPHVSATVSLALGRPCVLLLGARDHTADQSRLLAIGQDLFPHVAIALARRQANDQARLDARLLAALLDGASAGLIIMNAEGRVLSHNAAAGDILQAGDGLRFTADHLTSDDQVFNTALAAVLEDLRANHRPTLPRYQGLLVRRTSGKPPYVLTFQVLEVAPMSASITGLERVLLQIVDPVPGRLPCLHFLMDSFGLTRAEARVCQRLANGDRLNDAAAALYVSPTTVKSHLQRVYAKLGIRSRSDLLLVLQGSVRVHAQPTDDQEAASSSHQPQRCCRSAARAGRMEPW